MYYTKQDGTQVSIDKYDLYLSRSFHYSIEFFNNEENRIDFHLRKKEYEVNLKKYVENITDYERFFIDHVLQLKNEFHLKSNVFNKNLDIIFRVLVLGQHDSITLHMCHSLYKSQLTEREKQFISFFINEESLEKNSKLSTQTKTLKSYAAIQNFIVIDFAKKMNIAENIIEKYTKKARKNDIFLDILNKFKINHDENSSFIEGREKIDCIILKHISASMNKELIKIIENLNKKYDLFHFIYFIDDESQGHKILFNFKNSCIAQKDFEFIVNRFCQIMQTNQTIHEHTIDHLVTNHLILNQLEINDEKRNIYKIKL